jgi:hypothetical protein
MASQMATISECRYRWLRVRDLNVLRRAGQPNWASDTYQVRLSIAHRPRRLPPFSLRTPQRNRNELGETTVNKTWRKHLP